MSRSRATLRLFVAIYPPVELARSLLATVPAPSLPPHRPVPVEQIHLTLQFIGDTPVDDLEGTIESVRRSGAGLAAFELIGQRLISLPERGAARLVAVETDAPSTLVELKSRLVTRLAREPRRDRRPYRPHLTLLRYRRPDRSGRVDRPLPDGPLFVVDHLVLVKSSLGPSGAVHEEVATVELAE